jgi:hypothetical protein
MYMYMYLPSSLQLRARNNQAWIDLHSLDAGARLKPSWG